MVELSSNPNRGAARMKQRQVRAQDLPLLAELNAQLIQDEGHGNPMSLPELEERMRSWLEGPYRAVLFELEDEAVAYALYRLDEEGVYLRQFFVRRDQRRRGLGREAIRLLQQEGWPPGVRVTLEVLVENPDGLAFWRACGFEPYSLTLERPGERGWG